MQMYFQDDLREQYQNFTSHGSSSLSSIQLPVPHSHIHRFAAAAKKKGLIKKIFIYYFFLLKDFPSLFC